MTEPDFDDIARLWRQPPGPEEEQAFRALARRASFRARLLRHSDLGIALLLILAVIVALALRPAPATLAVGILTIAGVGWSSWKRHLLGRMAATVETSDRRDLVHAAVVNASADLKRSNLGLCLLFPGVLLGAMLNHSFKHQRLEGFGAAFVEGITDWPWGIAVLLAIIAAFMGFLQGNRRLRKELARLRILEAQYREEARLDEGDGG